MARARRDFVDEVRYCEEIGMRLPSQGGRRITNPRRRRHRNAPGDGMAVALMAVSIAATAAIAWYFRPKDVQGAKVLAPPGPRIPAGSGGPAALFSLGKVPLPPFRFVGYPGDWPCDGFVTTMWKDIKGDLYAYTNGVLTYADPSTPVFPTPQECVPQIGG